MQKSMEHTHNPDTLIGVILTVFLYLISRFTLNDFATATTIFAGLATGLLAVYRFWKESRSKPPQP